MLRSTVPAVSVDVPRVAHVICGEPAHAPGCTGEQCERDCPVQCMHDLWRTYGPAGSLWCPDHGHVLDVFPSPPLTGSVHLNFGRIEQNGWVELSDLAGSPADSTAEPVQP